MRRLSLPALAVIVLSTLPGLPTTAQGQSCTQPAPDNLCIPGGGSRVTDCQIEWLMDGPLIFRRGVPRNYIRCYEGDPSCDFDSDLGNGRCDFRGRLCINNNDARLDRCTPTSLATAEVLRPRFDRPGDDADSATLATLEGQLGNGPGGFGLTITRKREPHIAGGPNATPDLCSGLLDFPVPLKVRSNGSFATGTKRLRLQTVSSASKKDTDALRLVCRPSTCGNNTIEPHETCDDGNRNNGDGCNQACQIETGPTATPTVFVSPTPSNTPTITPTTAPTNTPTITPTSAPTGTPTDSPTVGPSQTPTDTPTETISPTPSETATTTPTSDPSEVEVELKLELQPAGGTAANCRGVCGSGDDEGESCRIPASNSGCSGPSGSRTCSGGWRQGLSCTSASDCPNECPNSVAGMRCTGPGMCVGGPFDGNSCTTGSQCNGCTASVNPSQGSCAVIENRALAALRLGQNGVCFPRTAPDVFCASNEECPGRICRLPSLNVRVFGQLADGTRRIEVDPESLFLPPAIVPGVTTACITAGALGEGILDCDGGNAGLNFTLTQDHDTSPLGCLGGPNDQGECDPPVAPGPSPDCPAPASDNFPCNGSLCSGGTRFNQACTTRADCPAANRRCNFGETGPGVSGFATDPECDNEVVRPDGNLLPCREGDGECIAGTNVGALCYFDEDCGAGGVCDGCSTAAPHRGMCNSPVRLDIEGTFGPGDMVVVMPLAITQISPSLSAEWGPDQLPCTADDVPPAPGAAVPVTLSTGTNILRIFDVNPDAPGSPGLQISPEVNCGAQPCVASTLGNPIDCTMLEQQTYDGAFDGLTFGGGFPALDVNPLGDIATTFRFVIGSSTEVP